MKVTFWGTRGSIATPGQDTNYYGGNTTCVEVTLESDRKIIIDAGTGIRVLGEHLVRQEKPIAVHLLITHIHWDHVSGFPFFSPIHKPETRIFVDGYPTCMTGLKSPFDNKMSDGLFPVRFEDLRSKIKYLDQLSRGPLHVDDVVIDTIPLKHPQGGFGFRFKEGGKTFVFLTDNEVSLDSLDSGASENYISFCRDADLLVLDAQFTPEEIIDRKGWGHSDYLTAIHLAERADAKTLLFFHHDPSRTDRELITLVNRYRDSLPGPASGLMIDAAREGAELTF